MFIELMTGYWLLVAVISHSSCFIRGGHEGGGRRRGNMAVAARARPPEGNLL